MNKIQRKVYFNILESISANNDNPNGASFCVGIKHLDEYGKCYGHNPDEVNGYKKYKLDEYEQKELLNCLNKEIFNININNNNGSPILGIVSSLYRSRAYIYFARNKLPTYVENIDKVIRELFLKLHYRWYKNFIVKTNLVYFDSEKHKSFGIGIENDLLKTDKDKSLCVEIENLPWEENPDSVKKWIYFTLNEQNDDMMNYYLFEQALQIEIKHDRWTFKNPEHIDIFVENNDDALAIMHKYENINFFDPNHTFRFRNTRNKLQFYKKCNNKCNWVLFSTFIKRPSAQVLIFSFYIFYFFYILCIFDYILVN